MTEETLFDLARKTPEAERPALLDRACEGDPELRARVEALLRADAGSSPFSKPSPTLDATTGFQATASYTSPDPVPGILIAGRYTLEQKLGEGGMGSVWRAKQTEPVKRFVAVKLIKAGMDSKQVLTRFEAERQTLALMDHPNIAKVLDGGLHEQRPFFVMELVKGTPITEYCDHHKLTPIIRLELFVQACMAIQHAHQKGIIHRDIKPSNVLVSLYDDKPVVKVIDFGVAKATGGTLTEATIDTGFGGVVGTPQYMSPEQATFNNLDIDTRSDVYALGVLLYELLAGSPPFSGAELKKKGFLEILRVVREEEPPRPSTKLSTADALPSLSANRGTEPKKLTGLLRNELDWIVMKALEKDRTRRYETANGFAADVHRYLAGEAVQAHPPSMGYRLKKFVRRNKGQVIAASLVFLALLTGVIGTSWQAIRATRAEAETSQQLIATRKAEAEAIAKTKEVQATLVIVSERTKLAQDAFGEMVFDIQTMLETRPGTQDLRRALLEKARTGLQKILEEARKQGTPDSTLVWSHFRMGEVESQLGNSLAAQKEYQAGHDLAQRLAEGDPKNAQAQRDLSFSFNKLGDVTLQLGQTKEALDWFQKCLAVRQRLAEADPKNAQTQRDLSVSFEWLGDLTLQLGQTKEALDWFQKCLAVRQRLADADPKNAQAHRDLSINFNKLGNVTQQLGQTKEALDWFQKCLAVFQRLADADPKNAQAQRDLSFSFERLGDMTLQLGQTKEALDWFQKSLAVRQRLADADPKNAQAQHDLSLSFERLGDVTLQLGQTKEALDWFQKCLAVRQRLADADPKNAQAQRDLSISFNKLGDVTLQLGQTKDAIDWYLKHLKVCQRMADADPKNAQAQRDLGISFERLGDMTLQLGQTKDAFDWFQKSLAVRQRLADADSKNAQAQRDLSISFEKLGDVTRQLGQTKEALDWYQKSLAVSQRLAGADPMNAEAQRDLSISFNKLGDVTLQLGQTKEALDWYQKSLALRQRLANADPKNAQAQRDLSFSFNKLGNVTLQLGQTKEALDWFQKCLAVSQKLADADPKNAQAQMDVFISYVMLGRAEMANQTHSEAVAWFSKAEQSLKDFRFRGWITGPDDMIGGWSVRQWQADIEQHHATCRKAEQALTDLDFALKQPAEEAPELLDIRVQVFARKKDRKNLLATAEAYEQLAAKNDHHRYNAACVWSLASGVASDDAKLREECAVKAMTLLRKTPTGKDYFAESTAKLAAHMKKDTDLDPLRSREDFKKMMAELEKTVEPKK